MPTTVTVRSVPSADSTVVPEVGRPLATPAGVTTISVASAAPRAARQARLGAEVDRARVEDQTRDADAALTLDQPDLGLGDGDGPTTDEAADGLGIDRHGGVGDIAGDGDRRLVRTPRHPALVGVGGLQHLALDRALDEGLARSHPCGHQVGGVGLLRGADGGGRGEQTHRDGDHEEHEQRTSLVAAQVTSGHP